MVKEEIDLIVGVLLQVVSAARASFPPIAWASLIHLFTSKSII